MHSLNHTFRLVWNESTQLWQAVSEVARGRGKSGASKLVCAAIRAGLGAMLGVLAPMALWAQVALDPKALPTGGKVVAGQASIMRAPAAPSLTVQQSSQRAVVNWDTFNLGAKAQIRFDQPSAQSVTLNRVLGGGQSNILGQLSAPGQVFISNPEGVLFGAGARVDVGSLLATTHRIDDKSFMDGQLRFERAGSTGAVINQGQLRSRLGGYIALLAPEVRNQGVVIAQAGTVAMAAGEVITLRLDGQQGLASLQTTPSAIASLVDNGHAVLAPDGMIILSAVGASRLQAGVIRSSGELNASSLQAKGGRIVLEGDEITLSAGSRTLATGAKGGGTVHVGGGWQGSGTIAQARQVTMAEGAVVDVSATVDGSGGEAVLWSRVDNPETVTNVAGQIVARGAGAGAGGRVETSGARLDTQASIRVDTQDAKGGAGLWLLDPYDYLIAPTGGQMTGAQLNSALSGASISILTSDASTAGYSGAVTTGSGDIVVDDAITIPSGRTLTLNAGGGISGTGAITNNGTLALTQVGSSTLSSVVSGTGVVTKAGAGSLTLSGNNSYSGATTVSAGTLVAGHNNALGSTAAGTTVAAGAVLAINSASVGAEAISMDGLLLFQGTTPSLAGTVYFPTIPQNENANYGVSAEAGTVGTISGVISNVSHNNGFIWKLGAGTVVWAASNTIASGLAVRYGTLSLAHAGALGQTFRTMIYGGATLDLANITLASGSNIWPFSGGTISSSAGSSAISQSFELYGPATFHVAAGASLTMNTSLAEDSRYTYAITKTGAGTLTLAQASSNKGALSINDGTVIASHGSSLGSTNSGVAIASGATLQLNGVSLSSEAITINGGTLLSTGVTTVPGAVTLGASSTLDVIGGSLTISGAIGDGSNGYGLTKTGSGTLVLSGANTYGGATTLSAATTAVSGSGKLGNATGATTVASGATLDIRGASLGAEAITLAGGDITASTGTGSSTGVLTLSADTTISVGTGASLTLGGGIAPGGSARALTKTGAGTLALGGTTALGGTVTVSTGTLTVGSGSSGTLSDSVVNNATLVVGSGSSGLLSGSVVNNGTMQIGSGSSGGDTSGDIVNNGTLTLNRSDSAGTVTGVISGSGGLTKTGSGSITLSANNTYSGGTSINAGALQFSGASASAGSGAISVASGAKLQLAGGVTLANPLSLTGGTASNDWKTSLESVSGNNVLSGALTITNMNTASVATGSTLEVNGNAAVSYAGTTQAFWVFDVAGTASVSGIISGATGLVKNGVGSLTLGGANTFTGNVSISNGTLKAASSSVLSSGSLVSGPLGLSSLVYLGGTNNNVVTLDVNGQTITNAIQPSNRPGVDAVPTIRNHTGNGILGNLVGSGSQGPVTYSVGTGASLSVTRSGASLGGTQTKDGDGTLISSGGSSVWQINAGLLQLSSAQTGNVTVVSGATLDLNGFGVDQSSGGNAYWTINGSGVSSAGALINSNTATTPTV